MKSDYPIMKSQRSNNHQLSIFSSHVFHKPPDHWTWQKYPGPKVGEICHLGFEIGLRLPANTLGCITVTQGYILEINQPTREVLVHCPLLKDAPWCKDTWFITDIYSCSPNKSCNFNEKQWRVDNPIKDYSGEVPWDLFNVKRENRE